MGKLNLLRNQPPLLHSGEEELFTVTPEGTAKAKSQEQT
jgi:hypothetical protein